MDYNGFCNLGIISQTSKVTEADEKLQNGKYYLFS